MKTESEIYVEAEMYAKTEKEKRLFGQRVSRCISTEEFQTEAYIAGFFKCQKEYEEKLRWIPVEEKLPPENRTILVKIKNEFCIALFRKGKFIQDVEFTDKDIVTHWRFL